MQDQEISTPRDNLLGICHAIGEAFGFDPLFLRLAFGVGMLINFEMAIMAYAALGVSVLAASVLAWLVRRADRISAAA